MLSRPGCPSVDIALRAGVAAHTSASALPPPRSYRDRRRVRSISTWEDAVTDSSIPWTHGVPLEQEFDVVTILDVPDVVCTGIARCM